ncbi:unnamed protein product [Parnassius apollo]|uniref:(apollo) hypothetical protein n=1 Tax=Parnassius apollo TaxID=110799 RepID=A0A8S3XU22_PARAO|nr:unnamed protein product [Parnassius apollo]
MENWHHVGTKDNPSDLVSRGFDLLALAASELWFHNGILHVGGLISQSDLPSHRKSPMLLPARHHVTDFILRYEHLRLLHAGLQMTLSIVRSRFWSVQAPNRFRRGKCTELLSDNATTFKGAEKELHGLYKVLKRNPE